MLIYFLSLFSFLFIFFMTPNGPGVTQDSVYYLMAAENFIIGKGFLAYDKPLTHFPPLYPILIGLISLLLNIDILQSARIISSLLMGLNVFLIGKIIKISNNNLYLGYFILLYFTLCSVMFLIHIMAWTEPIFLFLILLFLIIYNKFLDNKKLIYLLLLSLIIGITSILRYAGIFLFGTVLVLNFLYLKNFQEKVKYSIITIIFSSILPIVWFLRNYFFASNLTNRELVFNPFSIYDLKKLIYTFVFFIYPLQSISIKKIDVLNLFYFIIVFLFFVLSFYIFCLIIKNFYFLNNILKIILVINITYFLFIVFSKLFFDSDIPFDYRILSPLLITFFLALFLFSFGYLDNLTKHLLIFFLINSFFFNIYHTYNTIKSTLIYVKHYNSIIWKDSKIIKNYLNIKNERKVYSNGIHAIWFLTRNYSETLPVKYDVLTRKINIHFENTLENIFYDVEKGKAIIIFFNNIGRKDFPSKDELINYAHIKNLKIKYYEDGILIYSETIQINADDP